MQEMPKGTRSLIKIDLRKVAAFFAIIAAVIALDQLTKWVVVKHMTLGESIPVIKGFFHFTYILNEGAAFGMLADNRWVFLVFSSIAILVIAVAIVLMSGKLSWGYGVCFAMIVGGGVGNMIDRIFNGDVLGSGAVVDFIDFCGIWGYIFNVADSFVCVGAFLFVLIVFIEEFVQIRKKGKSEPNADTGGETAPSENGEKHE